MNVGMGEVTVQKIIQENAKLKETTVIVNYCYSIFYLHNTNLPSIT